VLRRIHAKESFKSKADGPSAPNHTAQSLQEIHSRVDPDSAKKLESRFQRAKDEVASHREWYATTHARTHARTQSPTHPPHKYSLDSCVRGMRGSEGLAASCDALGCMD